MQQDRTRRNGDPESVVREVALSIHVQFDGEAAVRCAAVVRYGELGSGHALKVPLQLGCRETDHFVLVVVRRQNDGIVKAGH